MSLTYPIPQPFALSADEVVGLLETDPGTGLSTREATNRSKQFGPNSYALKKQKPLWMMMLQQFQSPIVYLLAVGAAVALYFGDYLEAGAIVAVIAMNAGIGFFMEWQARTSMNALKKMEIVRSRVIRAGKRVDVPGEQLVPGDLVPLEAGDIVPADGRLVDVHQLQCDESSLTGESLPSDKDLRVLATSALVGDRTNMVFKGTSVIKGNGLAIVTGIALHTELGTITSLVEGEAETLTPLDKKLNRLTRKLIWVTIAMTAIFAVTGMVQGRSALLIIETSIALAVAAIPEGLPIVATVALSYGMLLMARRNAIVKQLASVETLGSTSVILTDKTGTLTENSIHLDTLAFPGETVRVQLTGKVLTYPDGPVVKSSLNLEKLITTGVLCNNAVGNTPQGKDATESLSGDPVEIALLRMARLMGVDRNELDARYPRIAEIPFSSETMMMFTLHRTPSGLFVAAKGSVEHLLDKCDQLQLGSTTRAMTDNDRTEILAASEKMAAGGLRVLGFACREGKDIGEKHFGEHLVYLGMTGFLDPPRTDIKGAIHSCRRAGISVVMITGDHPKTALNIAQKVGLIDPGDDRVITGQELPPAENLTEEWKKRMLTTSVFARTSPKQKLEIAGIFQAAGHIVAMTGDGVNDAPALKKADVGIAMGIRGTPVAKETASIILKDDSFTSIADAVAHGREIFQNIQKFVLYLVSCNLSEILIVSLLGILSPASTLLPLQILFLNMVTDIFPALALGVLTGDDTVMQRPPRDPKKDIVTGKTWITITAYALLLTLSVYGAVVYAQRELLLNTREVNNVAFITLTFAQIFHVFNMSSVRSGVFNNEITRNRFVWAAVVGCAGLSVGVFMVPGLRLVLGLSVLPATVWLAAILAGLFPLVVVQGVKIVRRRLRPAA